MAAGQPVISVDAKKKEQVGALRRGRAVAPGRELRVRVRDHDFPDEETGKVARTGFMTLPPMPGS